MILAVSNVGTMDRRCAKQLGAVKARQPALGEVLPRRIGKWGTGLKRAALASLLLDIRLVICSTDEQGPYALEFVAGEDDGLDVKPVFVAQYPCRNGIIVFDDVAWSETSFVIGAYADTADRIGNDGLSTAKLQCQILANAYDAAGEFTQQFTGKMVPAPPGRTTVYIQAKDASEFRTCLFVAPQQYFKFVGKAGHLAPPLYVDAELGQIWPKSDESATRIFVRGRLVACVATESSMFDYDLFDPEENLLAEGGSFADPYSFRIQLALLLARLTDPGLVATVFKAAVESAAALELDALRRITAFSAAAAEVWRSTVYAYYKTEKVAISCTNTYINNDAIQIFKYIIVFDPTQVLTMLGFPVASSIVPQGDDYDLVEFKDLDAESRHRFNEACAIYGVNFPERRFKVFFYQPRTEKFRQWAAAFAKVVGGAYREVYIAINADGTLPTRDLLLRHLLHEYRHCVSGGDDYNRMFVCKADDDQVLHLLRSMHVESFSDGTPVPQIDYEREISFDIYGDDGMR